MYEAGVNPAQTLYDLWLRMLSAQGSLARKDQYNKRAGGGYHQADHSISYPKIAYGDMGCAIGVWGYDDQDRPILGYGKWYRRQSGIYMYLAVDADGRFLLLNAHGDNHLRIERHTFLGFTHGNSQYQWFADPTHAYGESRYGNYRKDMFQDWQRSIPFLPERKILSRSRYDRTNGSYSFDERWMYLAKDARGNWEINAHPDNPEFVAIVEKAKRISVRHYSNRRRYDYAARGEALPNPTPSVRNGKTTLKSTDAVIHIAAFLDVRQPAKAVPLRPIIAEEANVLDPATEDRRQDPVLA